MKAHVRMISNIQLMKRIFILVFLTEIIVFAGLSQNIYVAAEENADDQAETDWMEGHIHRSEDQRWYYVSRNYIINEQEDDKDIVIVGRTRDTNITFPYETYEEEVEVNGEIQTITKTKFSIPSEIDGHKVTGIGNPCQNGYYNPSIPEDNARIDERRYAFNNFDDYDLVVVPDGVDMIIDYCFYGSGFKAISLPDSLTYIGENAFYFCEQLETMNIPSSVEEIGPRAFRGTPWLDDLRDSSDQHLVIFNGILVDGIMAEGDVVIPQNVKVVGSWAFYGNATGEDDIPSKITSVTIPSSVTVIGDYAFAECRSLTTVNFGNSVEKIGYLAFGRSGLKEIIVPSSVKYIDDGLCYECQNLETAKFACNAEHYGTSLFDTCTKLKNVQLPEKLTKIDRLWFWGCESLTDIKIPASVEEIAYKAFTMCSGLTKVILPESLQKIGQDAFLVNSDSSGDKIVFTIPEKMTDISGLGLLDLDYVTIRVLAGSNVEKYLIDNGVPTYQTYLKGAQDIYEGTINITNNNITNNETTIIDNSTTNIDNSTTINDNSTTINDNSTTNNINNNITDSNIENLVNAVNNETHLDSDSKADKADSVVTAGEVFVYKKMRYKVNDDEKTVSFICPDNKNVTGITIPKAVSYKDSNLKVTDINKNACKGMKKLKNVTIGANVDSIGEKAFYNCTKLKTVVIGKNVEEIGKLAFYGDKSIKKITFKNIKNLKSVGKAAFYLRSKSTDANLKAKQTSKKKMIKYLDNSGVSVSY